MNKHTSVPWEAYCMGSEGYWIKPGLGDLRHKGKRIAYFGQLGWEEDKANAEFVVRACNCHYELLGALKGIVLCLDRSLTLFVQKEIMESMRLARQAIAKAEEK